MEYLACFYKTQLYHGYDAILDDPRYYGKGKMTLLFGRVSILTVNGVDRQPSTFQWGTHTLLLLYIRIHAFLERARARRAELEKYYAFSFFLFSFDESTSIFSRCFDRGDCRQSRRRQ